MKLSKRLQDEKAFVERSLGDSVICRKCGATLSAYADACTADLQELCPGFLAIEQAKTDFGTAVDRKACEYCDGTGKVRYYHGDFDTCPTCHGSGKVGRK